MKVAWVHPSWRDLVIGRLADDPAARRRFISRCGVHGVVLALSTGGGAEGDRDLPLLAGDADWDALADRVYTLVAELEPGALIALMAALGAAIDGLLPEDAGREARAVAETALSRVAGLWRDARQPIALRVLDGWLDLAARLDPRPALPELGVTWAELLPVAAPWPDDRAEVERFADWLTLCRMLRSYDQRLRGTAEVNANQLLLAAGFLDRVERDIRGSSTPHVFRALDAIGDHLPSLRDRARLLAELGQLAEAFRDEPPAPAREPFEEPRERQAFDVSRVLMDL